MISAAVLPLTQEVESVQSIRLVTMSSMGASDLRSPLVDNNSNYNSAKLGYNLGTATFSTSPSTIYVTIAAAVNNARLTIGRTEMAFAQKEARQPAPSGRLHEWEVRGGLARCATDEGPSRVCAVRTAVMM